jgi:hypothetical protein
MFDGALVGGLSVEWVRLGRPVGRPRLAPDPAREPADREGQWSGAVRGDGQLHRGRGGPVCRNSVTSMSFTVGGVSVPLPSPVVPLALLSPVVPLALLSPVSGPTRVVASARADPLGEAAGASWTP